MAVKLRDEIIPDTYITMPQAGYIVPASYARIVIHKLRTHGIQFQSLGNALNNIAVERFNATKAILSPQSTESHQTLQLKGNGLAIRRLLAKVLYLFPLLNLKLRWSPRYLNRRHRMHSSDGVFQ
jgi:hypothetical protein